MTSRAQANFWAPLAGRLALPAFALAAASAACSGGGSATPGTSVDAGASVDVLFGGTGGATGGDAVQTGASDILRIDDPALPDEVAPDAAADGSIWTAKLQWRRSRHR